MIEHAEVIVRQPGQPDQKYTLLKGVWELGRAEDCQIVLPDVGVSRRHCKLIVTDDEVLCEDPGSGNGTWYNGYRVRSQQLQDGDELVIDPFVLLFRIRGGRARQLPATVPQRSSARLEVLTNAGVAGTSYPLTQRGLTMGRAEDAGLVLRDPAASRYHAQIAWRDGDFYLRDLGSSNGIFLNGARIRDVVLSDGDVLRIGNTELRFVRDEGQGEDATTRFVPPAREKSVVPGPRRATPAPVPARPAAAPKPRASAGRALLAAFAGGTIALVLVGGLSLLLLAAALLWWSQQGPSLPPSGPPRWAVKGAITTPTTYEAHFNRGVELMRAKSNRAALAEFHAALRVKPGDPHAERWADAAAERALFEGLTQAFTEREKVRVERNRERDGLLAEVRNRGKNAVAARAKLEAEWRDDPQVLSGLGLSPSPAEADRRAKVDGARRLHSSKPAEAWTAYQDGLNSPDPKVVTKSREGRLEVGKLLARATAEDWRAALSAEGAGDHAGASNRWFNLDKSWPSHPSRGLHPK